MRSTNRKPLSLLLCFVLLFGSFLLPASAFADPGETLVIRTFSDFLAFAKRCRLDSASIGLTVELENDLNLSGSSFAGIPVFSGTFNGNGNTILLDLHAEGSVQGLFRYLQPSAVVQDLVVAGTAAPEGSAAVSGGIAGENAGLIRNCTFKGALLGAETAGGIAGRNTVTGIIDSCTAEGTVSGIHFIGGIAGENKGTIRSCQNRAAINTTVEQNRVDLSDITLDSLTGSEAINTVTDIGGIAGISSGIIRSCENHGNVGYRQIGYNVGGIAGRQSGTILNCSNSGSIAGRKEVGGIAGQMEPSVTLSYKTDALQMLQVEVGVLSVLMDRAMANAGSNTAVVRGLTVTLKQYVQDAQYAIDVLVPQDRNDITWDPDTLRAALQTLSSSITGISNTMSSLMTAVETTGNHLTSDLQAVSNQVKVIQGVLNNAENNLGGSVRDSSDSDREQDLNGKVANCHNHGTVLADRNAGGIAGAIAVESDLDPEEDIQIVGSQSLNFSGEIRAVIRSCSNTAAVTINRQNGGGIVGWASLGLIRDCTGTGTVNGPSASYVGGIAGRSDGFLRFCNARCTVTAAEYAGGIAGRADTVTDCKALVQVSAAERFGAVIGYTDALLQPGTSSILRNYYLSPADDLGASDGISYAGKAEPIGQDAFLALEGLPENFRTVSVTFHFADGTQVIRSLPFGGSLSRDEIPALPEKEGCTASWAGLSEADLTELFFDRSYTAVYISHDAVIQSKELGHSALHRLLVQGDFLPDTTLTLAASEDLPTLRPWETLLESSLFLISGEQPAEKLRVLIPAEGNPSLLKAYVRSRSGAWSSVSASADGSYLVFPAAPDSTGYCLVQTPDFALWAWVLAGILVLAAAAVLLLRFRKKKKGGAQTEAEV
ncbi:MAG: hypothetical protein E7223_04755 [Clostridiales bacterium]|nr:hypothetical protein [Clostridiales bacterium]